MAIVYGLTSTCSLNPLEEVAEIARETGVKLLVDGVSALFVEPMDLGGLGISALMGSCNKGLHSHPNLTCALVRRSLMEEMAEIPAMARRPRPRYSTLFPPCETSAWWGC